MLRFLTQLNQNYDSWKTAACLAFLLLSGCARENAPSENLQGPITFVVDKGKQVSRFTNKKMIQAIGFGQKTLFGDSPIAHASRKVGQFFGHNHELSEPLDEIEHSTEKASGVFYDHIDPILYQTSGLLRPSLSPKLLDTHRSRLQDKHKLYLQLVDQALNEHGFVSGCDGLLFTSLLRIGGYPADLYQAQDDFQPGKWFRSVEKNCLSTGESKSTISRDMLLGLTFAFWVAKDLQGIQSINAYGEQNNWIMGNAIDQENLIGRTYIPPELASTFYLIEQRLSKDYVGRPLIPIIFDIEKKGFEANLLVLHSLLRAVTRGGMDNFAYETVRAQAKRQPRNAFFQYVFHAYHDGDMNPIAEILLDRHLFPHDQLPTSAHHCEPYLWQRDDNDNWQPCPEKNQVHPAIDFLFLARLLLDPIPTVDYGLADDFPSLKFETPRPDHPVDVAKDVFDSKP